MIQKYSAIAIGAATLALAFSFTVYGLWPLALATALVGLLWLILSWLGIGLVSDIGFALCTAAAAVGALFGLPPVWLLTSVVAFLVGWDLDHFAHSLEGVRDIRDEAALVKSHVQRLGIVAGLGWLLGWVALRVQLDFDFIWALALGLVTILGLSGAIRYIRRETGS